MQGWEATKLVAAQHNRLTRLLGNRPVTVDCSYEVTHRPYHRPHPVTGRLVCGVCHPIPESIEGK